MLIREIDPMHYIVPLLYPNRCDNEAFISERIDLTNVNAYLEWRNAENPEYKYNLFQVIVTAVLKILVNQLVILHAEEGAFLSLTVVEPAARLSAESAVGTGTAQIAAE